MDEGGSSSLWDMSLYPVRMRRDVCMRNPESYAKTFSKVKRKCVQQQQGGIAQSVEKKKIFRLYRLEPEIS